MAEHKILVVDDEERMRKLVRDFLVREGYVVIEAGDGEQALNMYDTNPDLSLVILDVMMPKMDGFEVARYIRRQSNLPIIMLTAKADESDELNGFEIGVDEYIAKPFSPKILVARVGAVIRRGQEEKGPREQPLNNDGNKLIAGGIIVDQSAHVVTVDGNRVELSVKEFELLSYFIENKGIALSRDTILNHVWNYDYFGDARTIDTHVKKLRNKMGDKGSYIKTIWGMGYKFEVD